MATTGSGQPGSFASRSGLPTFGNFGNTLLERSNPGLRKSTPDSEALASSDEEVEQSRLRSAAQRKALSNSRSSLFTDQTSEVPRRLSFAGNNPYSPAIGSQPNTPGASNDAWSSVSPGVGAWNTASAYPFGTNIWGANSRDPPSRLQEVRQDNSQSRIPFAIPSQPNSSAQRSMSFSVGQSEYDTPANGMDTTSRPVQGLTRRTSRPSNLGHEYGGLSSVNENEDADQYFTGAPQSGQAARLQARAMSNTSQTASSAFRGTRLRNAPLEGSEIAVDDVDESAMQYRVPVRNAPSRRLSDFQPTNPTRQPIGPHYSNATFGNTRNIPHWSSNLDFGQLDTIPQSRRHSFADVPTRRGSMGSNGMPRIPLTYLPSPTGIESVLTAVKEEDDQSASYDAGSQVLSQDHEGETRSAGEGGRTFNPDVSSYVPLAHSFAIASYFNRNDIARRITEQEVQQQLQQEHHQAVFGGNSPYGMPTNASSIGSFHGPNPAPLYVVNFKCCRSDIFYIQEGTGLSVRDGDLVIVEADRGTDLGSVQHSNVSWEAARKYKAKYAEQHFGWLMMFSQQTRSGAPNLYNPNAAPAGRNGASPQGSAVRDSDLKPKMIKRLAATHEIQALQEKEGNEAKAKRICQQKVIEHGLNMEVLDAEFQMDGKKLTFYFFSNEYINFNSLVTDLFKMYKTRIWMSAINPASFQSPVSSLGITPIYGNAGLGVTNTQSTPTAYDEPRDDTRYIPQAQQIPSARAMPPPLYYGGYGQAPQIAGYGGYASNYQQPPADPFSNYPQQSYGMHASRPQNMQANRQEGGGRHPQMSPSANHLANQFGSLSLAR
ncbi:hypothetical protein OHC33_005758 [Knufia fluminis]|uniref:PSP1 C-terminal domain-containing protein n=1 Tax=Knufia fluminis TaxID=191047 RepID=A0AAN8EPH2_9EURO|nr:hypothetical protein OHC33_005758 [Knufia fluminis]